MARINPLVLVGLGVAAFWMFSKTAGGATLPNAGSPTEYWFDPVTNRLWYEFGGVLQAPQAGMRPASSYEISNFWPPVNRPEFSAGPSSETYY